MYAQQPKKLLIVNILDILRKYSDKDHTLSQKDISRILRDEYNMTADRKAIRKNIIGLMEAGYEIEYSESVRMVPNAVTGELEESYIWSDFYLVRDITDAELRMLIDSVLFSGHIPHSQRKELAKKLEKFVRLEDYADMTPVELSTGMRQRLGLARVLASQAQVLLMDEPFASLDFITRGELQAELLDIQKELQKTILLVTHQLDEALLLAQRIVVLHADSSVRVWELELPYPRDLTSPQLAALREEITAECRKD